MNGNISELLNETDAWIDKYLNNPAEVTFVEFYLEYFNKTNSRFFILILRKLETLKSMNRKYIINWYYDEGDEDILEKGEYISELLGIPFNFIEIYDTLLPEYNLISRV